MDKSKRFELRLDTEIINNVDKWRKEQSNLPSRAEAFRQLVETGLGTSSKLTYMAMKFKILSTALLPGMADALSDSNVFAWQTDVYPFHDIDQEYWAEPFKEHFAVSPSMIEELAEYLDEIWRKDDSTTFYELEERYRVREGTTGWDRPKLINACKYMFIRGMFDNSFWVDGILENGKCPVEAKSIIRKFNRSEDIFLG